MEGMKSACIPYLGIYLTDLTYLSAAECKAPNETAAEEIHEKMLVIVDQIAGWQTTAHSKPKILPYIPGVYAHL